MSTSRTVLLLLYLEATIFFNATTAEQARFGLRSFTKYYCVEAHNSYRTKHKVPNIKWSDILENEAKSWAQYLSESNNLFRGSKGENIYLSAESGGFTQWTCRTAVEEFYSEESKYNYNRALLSRDSERFTQLVWKNTLEIGAAGLRRKDGKIVVVVRYNPPGNYNTTEAFKMNVFEAPKQTIPNQSSSAHVKIQIPLTLLALLAAMFIVA